MREGLLQCLQSKDELLVSTRLAVPDEYSQDVSGTDSWLLAKYSPESVQECFVYGEVQIGVQCGGSQNEER